MGLKDSVQAGLDQLEPLDVRDRAAADLALLYAAHLDDIGEWADKLRDTLAELGPKLLAALTALQMTPAARKAVMAGAAEATPPSSPLDELRAKRKARGAS